ncbi:MAG: tetratricopeptide repeat protein [Chloracidobacterium sp.]|nr:tetratricopeptide repeat protein [Chloracidobacterium sp.]
MPNRSRMLLIVFSVICLCHSVIAKQLAPAGPPSMDEAALRALVLKYFEAYAKKDLDAIVGLWSKEAPGGDSRRARLQGRFADEEYQFSEPVISRIKIEDARASARAFIERRVIRFRGSSTTNINSVRSDLSFVKENGEWKFWSETPAVASLANALRVAKTDTEREALLAVEQDLVNRELLGLLASQSYQAFTQPDYPLALSILIGQRLVAEKLGEKKTLSETWMNTGIIYFTQKRYQLALDAYQEGLAIEEELGRKSQQANFLTSVGLAQSALGKPQQAIEYLKRGLAIHEELNEKSSVAETLENIGNVHSDQGDYAIASEFYRLSLKWIESPEDYASRLIKIAKTEYDQGNDDAAIASYSEAARKLESTGNKSSVGYAMHNIANIYYSQGDYAQAMNYYRRCLAAEKESGTPQGVAGALQGIGLIHSLDGNHELALEAYRENLSVVETLADKSNVAAAWEKVGGSYFSLNQWDQSLEAFQKALALREQEGDSQQTANTLIDIGVTYASKGDFAAALDAYQRARGFFESAKKATNFSGDIALGIATVLMNESMISYAQKDYGKTIEQVDKAAEIAKQYGDPDIFWQARHRAGKAQFRSGKLDLARQAFGEAISTIEKLRPQQRRGNEPRFYESKLAPYQAMVDVAISEGKGNEAFEYAERAKSRALTGVLQSARVWITKTMTPREREREGKFLAEISAFTTKIQREMERQSPNKARVTDLTEKLGKAQKDYTAFRDALFARRPQLKTLRGEGKPFDAARAAALLNDAETALLDYVETDENLYLFAFTRTGGRARARQPAIPLKIYILGVDRNDLNARASRFQDAISSRSDDAQAQARELYDLLLKPAKEQITAQKHLIIAPDAVSWNLPFQALRTEDGRYLIENYAVSYTPSLTALGAISTLRARPKPPRKASPSGRAATPALLALVNPALSPAIEARINSLLPSDKNGQTPYAENEVEVEELSKLYGERQIAVLAGPAASEDRMKAEAGKYDMLHLDVRSVLNETAPLFSFSALSSGAETKEDGVFEVKEIFDLDLKSDLAMITGAELAWPKAGAMRSMTGLTWAWFVAGCPAIVVSRWRTDESFDLELEFHRRIKSAFASGAPGRRESKARIWQAAVKQSLSHEERRHPYFWAGFSILGDAR